MIEIIKRDGRQVPYNKNKIREAMIAAFNEEYLGKSNYSSRLFKYERLIEEVQHKVEEFATRATINVEQIQDFIVDNLKNVEPLVAVRYKKYRDSRTAIREKETDKYKEALDKINAKNIQSNNANVDDACFTGRQKGFQEVYYKAMMLDEMPELYANNHIENLSYIHDLDSYGLVHNCLSLPIDMLLLEGAMVGGQDLRPAKSIGSAMQMTAVYIQLQSQQQFGGCSVTHLDTTAVPYIRYSFYKHFKDGIKYVENYEIDFYMTDTEIRNTSVMDRVYMEFPKAQKYAWDMTRKDTYQAIEALMHNLNTLMSRPGSQLPFSSVNLLLDTTKEGRMFSETYLRINIKGLGKLGITSVFPCFIAQLKDGVNRKPGDPNYDLFLLALESSAKRIYPNFVNCDWSVHKSWIAKDREMRTKIYEELGQKFYNACIKHPSWMDNMRIRIVGDKIMPIAETDPLEEASTMGKGNYSSFKTM